MSFVPARSTRMLTVALAVLLATGAGFGQSGALGLTRALALQPQAANAPRVLGGAKSAPGAGANKVDAVPPYTWSEEAYTYRDLGAAEKLVQPGYVQLPFAVAFGGRSWAQLYIDDSGYVSFTGPADTSLHDLLPSVYLSYAIAPLWDELVRGDTGTIRFGVLGAEPHRELVLEWKEMAHAGCNAAHGMTFQAVLFEDSADILFNYANASFAGACSSHDFGASATVGLQTNPSTAATFSHGQPLLHDHMTLRWRANLPVNPEPTITMLQPDTWAVDDSAVAVIVRGTDLQPGTTVLWDGAPRSTNFIADNEIYFILSRADLTRTGIHQVAAVNALPGGGTSNALSFTVTQPDFKVQPGASSLNLGSGPSLTVGITVEPVSVYRQDVTLSCANLPAEWSCSFSPATVNPQTMPVVSALTITNTKAQSATHLAKRSPHPRVAWSPVLCLVAFLFPAGFVFCRRTGGAPHQPVLGRTGYRLAKGIVLFLCAVVLLACGGGGGSANTAPATPAPAPQPAPVTRTITVAASSGGIQHTCTFTVVAAN